MPRVFYDEHVDPNALGDETIVIIGYGIQGRAQALNLRDSGARVLVGNRDDVYREQAKADGFDAFSIREAVGHGTIILFLLPDEVHPLVFTTDIREHLRAGHALILAHGFSVRYGLLDPPDSVDLMLLAPRLPGHYVRDRYLHDWGNPH
jgi:ketol-acid reductoisomerase